MPSDEPILDVFRESRIEELPAMVFADAKGVEAHLIGVFDLLDELSQTVLRADGKAVVVESGCEAVNADLHPGARCSLETISGHRC
jgi:hypothetical protein